MDDRKIVWKQINIGVADKTMKMLVEEADWNLFYLMLRQTKISIRDEYFSKARKALTRIKVKLNKYKNKNL